VENFQNSHKVANEHKLTSEEANFQKDLQDQASNITKPYRGKQAFVKASASGVSSGRGAASRPIHLLPVSSSGREVNKGHDTPHIGDISYMLHAAGHQKTISLRQIYHPDLNQSEGGEYQRVLDYTRSHSVRQEEMKLIEEHKHIYNLQKKSGWTACPL